MIDKRPPRVDSAIPTTEPNISDAIRDSSESDKDISSKPTSGDANSTSQKKDPAFWHEKYKEALKNYPKGSEEYDKADRYINDLEKANPQLKSTDTQGSDNSSSNDGTQESKNSNSQPTDTSQDDTSKGNLSGDYGQNADPNATGDFTYFLKNPDAPRSMNADDMRDRYSQEKGSDNATPTEPQDTGESDIT